MLNVHDACANFQDFRLKVM